MTPWLDRVLAVFAPLWAVRRQRARLSGALLQRHFEADAVGRRTQGWARAGATDANAANTGARKREVARDLVRNNSYAESALSTIVDHAVGWGIVAKPSKASGTAAARNLVAERWKAWAETTACDADGRLDFAGLQKQVMRTVAQDGEVLIRRRFRRSEDGLPIPLQLQVLEADFLDTQRDSSLAPFGGGRVIQGIELDGIGRRAGYWLFPEHPGSSFSTGTSRFIPASEILHIFKPGRPGQLRGVTWFAPVMLKLKDFDEYEDAALMKQKIAACLAVLTSDMDGSSLPLGATTPQAPGVDTLEPGMILNLAPGRTVEVVQPPSVSEHAAYCQTVLRAVATGLGVTYEDLTGDYQNLPFSAARMSRLRHWSRVEDWRWRMLIPQFCDPVWRWAMEAAIVAGMRVDVRELPTVEWTAPPAPMVEPDKEGLAYQRNIRSGLMTLSEAIRERGYSPDELLNEMAADNKTLDRLGLILDSDPRRTSQAGQPRETAKAAPEPLAASTPNGHGARIAGE